MLLLISPHFHYIFSFYSFSLSPCYSFSSLCLMYRFWLMAIGKQITAVKKLLPKLN